MFRSGNTGRICGSGASLILSCLGLLVERFAHLVQRRLQTLALRAQLGEGCIFAAEHSLGALDRGFGRGQIGDRDLLSVLGDRLLSLVHHAV